MKRIAIIDHTNHILFVEDIDEYELINKYNDDWQKYINENYTFEGEYSWDWITDAQYFPEFEKDPIEIDFEEEASQDILEWDEENKKINLEF